MPARAPGDHTGLVAPELAPCARCPWEPGLSARSLLPPSRPVCPGRRPAPPLPQSGHQPAVERPLPAVPVHRQRERPGERVRRPLTAHLWGPPAPPPRAVAGVCCCGWRSLEKRVARGGSLSSGGAAGRVLPRRARPRPREARAGAGASAQLPRLPSGVFTHPAPTVYQLPRPPSHPSTHQLTHPSSIRPPIRILSTSSSLRSPVVSKHLLYASRAPF